MDLFNSEIITYTVGSRPTYSFSEMLNKAFKRLSSEDELLLHSDQGWHYQMKQYRQALKKQAITQSMSRKGNCYDNAVMENFFGIMKSEFLYLHEFESVDHFKQELERYMDYYNHKRIKSKLKAWARYNTELMPNKLHKNICLTLRGHFISSDKPGFIPMSILRGADQGWNTKQLRTFLLERY